MFKFFQFIERIVVEFLLAIAVIGKNIWRFLNVILKPVLLIVVGLSRIVFNRVLVPAYRLYLLLLYKLGWTALPNKSIIAMFLQKPLHITVGLLTFIFVFYNITDRVHAQIIVTQKEATILDTLIAGEFATLEENQLIEEFFDQEAYLSPTQQRYLDDLFAMRPQMAASPGLHEQGLISNDLSTDDDHGYEEPPIIIARKNIITYTVKAGDTISTIAANFGISVSTILWENSLTAYSVIRPGDILNILPQTGVSYKIKSGDTLGAIASIYGIKSEDIMSANGIDDSGRITIGQKIVLPGAKKVASVAAAPKQSSYSGINAIINIVKPDNAAPIPGNKMQWPTVGHRITQYYSAAHRGLDIANKIGTPLYAADSGVVEYAGWGTGYGNQVVIDHGGGKKTRYAHASKLYVKRGEKVAKGETIAAMGSTGWSTGSHIHFEVIINGVKYNPLNYIQ